MNKIIIIKDDIEEFIEINKEEYEVYIINSISYKHSDLRQNSKPVTYAKQYGGTFMTLMNNCGFTKKEAMDIDKAYEAMYKETRKWEQKQIEFVQKNGFIELAFGLLIQAPLLKKTILNTRLTPKLAEAQKRTIINALGQSWGLLNNRAAIDFLKKVKDKGYFNFIRPILQIHDSQYYLVKDDIKLIEFVNTELKKSVEWQDDDKIKHDIVHLTGNCEIYDPDWSKAKDLDYYLKIRKSNNE